MSITRTRRLAVVAGLAGATVATVLVAAPPAAAGPNCSPGYHCVFLTSIGSARKSYFNSDRNFANDVFEGTGINVNDNTWSASNSTTANRESHYYYNPGYSGGLVFCVNPGSSVNANQLSHDGVRGNNRGQRDEASSLRVRGRTPVRCF
jgi:hypothetical protein